MVAGKQEIILPQGEGQMVGGVARGGERGERPAGAGERVAIAHADVGHEGVSPEASSGLISPICSGRAGRCGPSPTVGAPVAAWTATLAGE